MKHRIYLRRHLQTKQFYAIRYTDGQLSGVATVGLTVPQGVKLSELSYSPVVLWTEQVPWSFPVRVLEVEV